MFATVASLLENRMGLAVEAVGAEFLARVVRRHMVDSGLSDEKEYLDLLQKPDGLWDSLVEAVVIPETWFFRNSESFSFLGRLARSEWLTEGREEVLRILSVPCATGEEPYSIAMALMDAAVPSERFRIEAMDISGAVLEKAKSGIYGQESFRGLDLAFRERYFDAGPNGFQLKGSVMDTVRFFKGNLLDGYVPSRGRSYDAIFCRNLLIYLTPSAKKQAAGLLDRSLNKEGIVFVGHIEYEIFRDLGFEKIRQPKVFACRRTSRPQRPRGGARHSQCETGLVDSTAPPPTAGATAKGRTTRRAAPPGLPGPDFARKPARLNERTGKEEDRRADERTVPGKDPEADRGEASLFDSARKLADQGLLQDGLQLCKELLRRNALHVQGHFLMALICLALNDNRGAADCFNKAAYLDPGNDEALDYLAMIAEQDGDWSGAAQLRQRAQRIRARENQG